MNVKPTSQTESSVQMNVYPKLYDDLTPYFTVDINYANIRCGSVRSRSKLNVYGIVWCIEPKKCRIFIAFEDETMHQKFDKYFRELLNNLKNKCVNGK